MKKSVLAALLLLGSFTAAHADKESRRFTVEESESAGRFCRDGLKIGGEDSAPVAENCDVQNHRPAACR
jgi:hypothetical protein